MNRDPRQVLTEWLVLAAQNGSDAAFTDLYGLWQADFRRFALARVERSEAAELVPVFSIPADVHPKEESYAKCHDEEPLPGKKMKRARIDPSPQISCGPLTAT